MTIDERLEEAGRRVREAIATLPHPTPDDLRRRHRRRRAVELAAGTLGGVALIIAAVALTPSPGAGHPFGSGQLDASDDNARLWERYEAAYQQVAGCLWDHGYEVIGPNRFGSDPDAAMTLAFGGPRGDDPTKRLDVQVVIGSDDATWDEEELSRRWERCKEDAGLQPIEKAWLEAIDPTLIPWSVWVDNLLKCIAEHEPIPDGVEAIARETWPADTSQWTDAHRWVRDAAFRATTEYGCRPWEG